MMYLRDAFRVLTKHRMFTLVAVATLALGVGVNSSMFSVLNAVLLQPLSYPEGDRLVRILRSSPQSSALPHSVPDFLDYQEQASVFTGIAAFSWIDLSFAEEGQPAERLRTLG